jgi:hypothetical protein
MLGRAPLQMVSPKESEAFLLLHLRSKKMASPIWSFTGESVFLKKRLVGLQKKKRSQN